VSIGSLAGFCEVTGRPGTVRLRRGQPPARPPDRASSRRDRPARRAHDRVRPYRRMSPRATGTGQFPSAPLARSVMTALARRAGVTQLSGFRAMAERAGDRPRPGSSFGGLCLLGNHCVFSRGQGGVVSPPPVSRPSAGDGVGCGLKPVFRQVVLWQARDPSAGDGSAARGGDRAWISRLERHTALNPAAHCERFLRGAQMLIGNRLRFRTTTR
jgi:hypothetical protein